jgi:RNA polymerase sigma-70 factor (ECF subfamily)
MEPTEASLLDRLRQPDAETAWHRFVDLYTPPLYRWARSRGLQEADAGDLVQDVFVVVLRKLPGFRVDPGKSFRAWLRTVARNRWRDRLRRESALPFQDGTDGSKLPPTPDTAAEFAEEEYRNYLARRALEVMRAEFRPGTCRACWEHVVSGKPAARVAAELGMTPGAVYVARSRVLARLRRELRDLID